MSSTRTMYQQLLSPSRPTAHRRCRPADSSPFGPARTCTSPLFVQISEAVEDCQQIVPSISLHNLKTLATADRLAALVAVDFPSRAIAFDDQFYLDSNVQISQLCEAAKILSKGISVQGRVSFCLKSHEPLTSDKIALAVIRNLKTLQECINNRKQAIENSLWKVYDDHPEQAEAKVNALMNHFAEGPDALQGKIPNIDYASFQTLGVKCWLDDEVVNYFVTRWCSQSGTTLGLSTFFPCKVLFQENGCVNARCGYMTDVDELVVTRWCRRAMNLSSWDSVFIPINESGMHWYSARIDFRLKRIDIYDSLRDRCIKNRQKPALLRRNAKLMLLGTSPGQVIPGFGPQVTWT